MRGPPVFLALNFGVYRVTIAVITIILLGYILYRIMFSMCKNVQSEDYGIIYVFFIFVGISILLFWSILCFNNDICTEYYKDRDAYYTEKKIYDNARVIYYKQQQLEKEQKINSIVRKIKT